MHTNHYPYRFIYLFQLHEMRGPHGGNDRGWDQMIANANKNNYHVAEFFSIIVSIWSLSARVVSIDPEERLRGGA